MTSVLRYQCDQCGKVKDVRPTTYECDSWIQIIQVGGNVDVCTADLCSYECLVAFAERLRDGETTIPNRTVD